MSRSSWVPDVALHKEGLARRSDRAWGGEGDTLVRKPWGLFIPILAQRSFCGPGEPMGGQASGSLLCLSPPGLHTVLGHSPGLRRWSEWGQGPGPGLWVHSACALVCVYICGVGGRGCM